MQEHDDCFVGPPNKEAAIFGREISTNGIENFGRLAFSRWVALSRSILALTWRYFTIQTYPEYESEWVRASELLHKEGRNYLLQHDRALFGDSFELVNLGCRTEFRFAEKLVQGALGLFDPLLRVF